jgi:hypothetical protein
MTDEDEQEFIAFIEAMLQLYGLAAKALPQLQEIIPAVEEVAKQGNPEAKKLLKVFRDAERELKAFIGVRRYTRSKRKSIAP